MATNNHPAHGPVSLDRLHQIREILSKAAEQSDGGNLGYAMADAVKVIDGAIAAFGAEPVAWLRESAITDIREGAWTPIIQMESQRMGADLSESWGVNYIPLYTAPPAPVVQEELLSAMEEVLRISDRDHEAWHKARDGIASCRAAMLQAGNHAEQHLDMVGLSGDTNEKGKDGTLINECTMPVTQIKPVADLYGITSPTGSETTFTFDAGEASSFAKGGWTVQEYVELERYQEAVAGNSPVTPDGWIPVSERMPERDVDVQVYCADKKEQMVGYMERNETEGWFRFASLTNGGGVYCKPTHWMPLPASPHFREIGNSSTNNCRENAKTSTNQAILNSNVTIDCWCHTCWPVTINDMRFVVCPECGNKRCPRANDHRNACTGSNEPGQIGSAYQAAPQQEVKNV